MGRKADASGSQPQQHSRVRLAPGPHLEPVWLVRQPPVVRSGTRRLLERLVGLLDRVAAPAVRLQRVGYWRQDAARLAPDGLPYPSECTDAAWDPAERARVLEYLRAQGSVHASYFGHSQCRICAAENGCHDLTDGTHIWPSGYAHYIEQHQVKPPPDFLAHALRGGCAP